MTTDEYWHGDTRLHKAYRESHEIKEDILNMHMYRMGAYFYGALIKVSPALHAFTKSPKPEPYFEKPIPRTKKQAKELDEQDEDKQIANDQKAFSQFFNNYKPK